MMWTTFVRLACVTIAICVGSALVGYALLLTPAMPRLPIRSNATPISISSLPAFAVPSPQHVTPFVPINTRNVPLSNWHERTLRAWTIIERYPNHVKGDDS